MIIKKIEIKNLQLLKSVSGDFGKINIISGKNLDNPNNSGNGSGKSTIVLRAILFALYGHVEEGLTLKDLIRFNEKEACVEIEVEKDNKIYKIIRKIPSELRVYSDDNEIQANTSTIKQRFIDEVFGDVNFFRSYRCVDIKNGINILDMGIVSVRKTLMGFIEGIFTDIRTRLLAQKTEREKFSKDKRLYQFYLSEKKLKVLEDGLQEITKTTEEIQINLKTQNTLCNDLIINEETFLSKIAINEHNIELDTQNLQKNQINIDNYKQKIEELKTPEKEIKTSLIDYESKIKQCNFTVEDVNKTINIINSDIIRDRKLLEKLQKQNTTLEVEIKEDAKKTNHLKAEINTLNELGNKCDKCKQDINPEIKEQFIIDNDFEMAELTEKNNDNINNLNIIKKEIDTLSTKIRNDENMIKELQNNLDREQVNIKSFNKENLEQLQKQQNLELATANAESDKNKYLELIESCKKQTNDYSQAIEESKELVLQYKEEIQKLTSLLEIETDVLEDLKNKKDTLYNKEKRTCLFIAKLKEAFKFSEYKYSKSDIVIYDETIKVLDSFAGEYIREWLSSLSVIINNLLNPVNISVEFTADKDFLKVKDNSQTLKYDQLSTGQRCFLSVIFKLAILMQQNKTGIILMDDGLGSIDQINFKNLIEICKALPFQIIAVYQNYNQEIEDVKQFMVIRENGVSNVS